MQPPVIEIADALDAADCEREVRRAGGETDFFGRRVTPRRGAAILFPHELRHEGRPVLGGVKYVPRTDVMYAAEPR